MGLTLVAILTAALLLPGIVSARAFYFSAQTAEVEVPTPPLSTSDGIALVGSFSVAVHFLYVVMLLCISKMDPLVSLPLANPYIFLASETAEQGTLAGVYAVFSGLVLLCILAALIGFLFGKLLLLRDDRSTFYGPLSDVLSSAKGNDRFIVAYVVSKIAQENRLLGYQGTVTSMFRDEDRYPSKVILRDVAPFYLEMGKDGPVRHEADESIDWIALSAEDWHNIAFRVYRVENAELLSEDNALEQVDLITT
jgi:hypothetical protein